MARRTELVDVIRDMIITGAFQPGMSVPEDALATEFKVSRSPVREALIMLEGRALVSTETNRGFRVSSVSVEAIRNYFVAAKTILPVVAALAANHASDADFAPLAGPDGPMPSPRHQSCGTSNISRAWQGVREAHSLHLPPRSRKGIIASCAAA